MRSIRRDTQFKRDVKRLKKRHKDFEKLKTIIQLLVAGERLPPGTRDHRLKGILKDWAESHPNDPVAQWMYPQLGRYRKPIPTAAERAKQRWPWSASPMPSWIEDVGLVAERGEPVRGEFKEGMEEELRDKYGDFDFLGRGYRGWERSVPEEELAEAYEYTPGEIQGLRPMGGQLSLTSDQMEQLMYASSWLKGGKPTTAKGWLQTAAYRMPNWWADYLATSEAAMPKVSPPRVKTAPARQR